MKEFGISHLLDLSTFVDKIKSETSTFSTRDMLDVIKYNDLLKQKPTKPLLYSLFSEQELKKVYFLEICDSGVYDEYEIETLNDFAICTKYNPLRFKK